MDESINFEIVFKSPSADSEVTEDELTLLESLLPELIRALIEEFQEGQAE